MNPPETNTTARNILPMALGLAAGFVNVFFLSEIFQGLIAFILGGENIRFGFSDFNFHLYYEMPPDSGVAYPLVIAASAVLFVLGILKLSTTVLIRSKLGPTRFFAIFFQLMLLGWLLISVFYGTFVVTLKAPVENDWLRIVDIIGLQDFYRALFMFVMIALSALYLQVLSRRIKIYIGDHKK